jgi:hypothetical protein
VTGQLTRHIIAVAVKSCVHLSMIACKTNLGAGIA